MGVYIRGMEMPKCCADCVFSVQQHGSIVTECVMPQGRGDYCPLIEVKAPHGRLIDADVLCERLMTEWDNADELGRKIISGIMADVVTPIVVGTPTVIEREE